MWGQGRSSTSGWRRDGNRTDERTCTLVGLVEGGVEEIGILAPSSLPTKKDREIGKVIQGHQQENIEEIQEDMSNEPSSPS